MVNIITDGGGHMTYGIKEYAIDTQADLKKLPTDAAPGSTAICIETSAVYMLNGSRKWVEI